jgi:hypothetical protein
VIFGGIGSWRKRAVATGGDLDMAKRKPTTPAKPSAMEEDRFWKLIEGARQDDDFITALTTNLKELPANDVVGFENTLQLKLAKASTFPLLAANFIIQSYVSDDVFEGFRAWLISQGRERFEAAVADPASICDWLERSEVDDINGEAMLLVAQRAYEEHGDEEEFAARITYPRKPTLKQDWPANADGYRKRWPRLVKKFWNLERIRELHRH